MKSILAPMAVVLALTAPAFADGKVYVQLPDLSSYSGERAEDFLSAVVLANVVSSNCPDYAVTDAEWSLLTDSADLLAYGQLKLSVNDYDNLFYDPAFDALDDADTCAKHGPAVEEVLAELVAQGGGREPLPDQAAAYTEWQALMDGLQSSASGDQPAAPTGKTKVK